MIIHQKSREFLFLLIFRLESCQRFEALFHPAYSSQSFRQKLSTLIEIQLKIVHKLMKIIFLNSNNISFVINSTLIFFEKTTFFWIWKNKFMYLSYFCKNWALCVVCKQNSSSVGICNAQSTHNPLLNPVPPARYYLKIWPEKKSESLSIPYSSCIINPF